MMDAAGDYVFGQGISDFWVNVPDAPAQVAGSRLKLFLGDWFLDQTQGTPWKTKVLGKYTASTRDMVVRARILGTPGVTGIAAYASQLNRDTRAWTAQATLDTAYGVAKISEPL